MNFMFRLAFAFEPLAPQAISLYLSRRLYRWKQQGLILSYKAHTKRLGKFHYKITVDLDVNPKQVHYVLSHLLPKQINVIRRWVNV